MLVIQDSRTDDVGEVTSRISSLQLDKVPVSPPTLKLPQLFSLIPTSGKAGSVQRRQGSVLQTRETENVPDREYLDPPSSTQVESSPEGFPCLLCCLSNMFYDIEANGVSEEILLIH